MKICVHNDVCGGCLYQGVSYDGQLRAKEKLVEDLLNEYGINPKEHLGFQPSPRIYRYRNKMEYTFGDMEKGGPITLGLHQKGHFMNIITTDECQLVDNDFNIILLAVLDFAKNNDYKQYNKKLHQGILRHLVIRKGERTGELLVNLVTSSQDTFDEGAFLEALLNLTSELMGTIVGVLRTINDNVADTVVSDETRILFGRDYYREQMMGLTFEVGAFSFFQTNVIAAENLYKESLEMIPNRKDKVFFDLYCGTGTITQALALEAKKVIGIEIVSDAVRFAKKVAEKNNLSNCEFIEGDVLKAIDSIEDKPDIIVMDPPRNGIHPKALVKIMALKVPEILYISCNPKTMMNNLLALKKEGYEVSKFKAYDNFPFTKHVEVVTLLTRAEETK